MKKLLSTLKQVAYATLTVGLLLSAGACSKDDLEKKVTPKGSTDERKSKAHGDPVKAVLTLYRGHLHGIKGFHQDPDIAGVKHLKATQTIVCKYEKTGEQDAHKRDIYAWRLSRENGATDKLRVLFGNYKGQDYDYPEVCTYTAVYGMTIRYFDANDQDITHQFVTKGQENIHQHFFIPKNIQPFYNQITWDSPEVKDLVEPYDAIIAKRYNKKLAPQGDNPVPLESWKLFYYFYSDTNPWDRSYQANVSKQNSDVQFVGFDNPTGFKGWFGFNNPIFDPQWHIVPLVHRAGEIFSSRPFCPPLFGSSPADSCPSCRGGGGARPPAPHLFVTDSSAGIRQRISTNNASPLAPCRAGGEAQFMGGAPPVLPQASCSGTGRYGADDQMIRRRLRPTPCACCQPLR